MANLTFFPSSDSKLLAWSANFSALITATPTAFNLTAPLATAYAALHTAFATALAAADPAVRSKPTVAAKNAARTALKNSARLLANQVNASATVTTAQKLSLGLNVKSVPSPIPAPSSAPVIAIKSVRGRTVSIKLSDSASSAKRGKPPGVSGASVFSFIGATPSDDLALWKFEGNTGRTIAEVAFPPATAGGAQVWLTAFWFNGRKQSGPATDPVTTYLQAGGVSLAA